MRHWILFVRGKLAASASAVRCGSSNADLVDAAAASAAAAPEEMPAPRDTDVDNEDVLDGTLDEFLRSPKVLGVGALDGLDDLDDGPAATRTSRMMDLLDVDNEDVLDDGPAATTEYITANPWVGLPYPKAGPRKGTAQWRRNQKKRAAATGRKSIWKLDADRALKQLKQTMREGGSAHQFDGAKQKLVTLWAKTFVADGGPEAINCCQKAAITYVDELIKELEEDAESRRKKRGRTFRVPASTVPSA